MDTSLPSLLTTDALVIQQTTAFASNDFEITDANGTLVGRVLTRGSLASRLTMGSRKFDVVDAADSPIIHAEDTITLGFDKWDLSTPDGTHVARLSAKFSLLRNKVGIEVDNDAPMGLTGNVIDWDFHLTDPTGEIATISREWAGVAHGFLGHSRYALQLAPALPAHRRAIVLGTVIALDRIRAKRKR